MRGSENLPHRAEAQGIPKINQILHGCVGAPERQANWHKTGGESPLKRRTNHPRFSASRASALVRVWAKRR